MTQSANKRTYYKRVLPSPPAIAFSSAEGREVFAEALPLGTMVGFFKLMEQFTTQEEPQYCGLAALSMTLNALGIDPRRTWKGAWRWFSETMLDCCKSLEDIKRDGITLSQAACLAHCNGADVSVHRYGNFDGIPFRRLLQEVCASEDRHMVVSYSRKLFKQSGDGHFSPIGGYNAVRDLVLILDVARFKYAPHWVRVDELIEAMGMLDPATGRPRGFLIMSCRHPRESALFTLDLEPWLSGVSSKGLEVPQPQLTRIGGRGIFHCSADRPSGETSGTAGGLSLSDDSNSGSRNSGCVADSGVAPLAVQAPVQSPGRPEPLGAAAHRFLTREVGALMRRLLDAPVEMTAMEADMEGHEEDDPEGAKAEPNGALMTTSGSAAPPAAEVPSVESLVGALVAAAPLQSVCALMIRRPVLSSVGELQKGLCCSCCLGGTAASGMAGKAKGSKEVAAGSDAAAAAALASWISLAPCNSSVRKGCDDGCSRHVEVALPCTGSATTSLKAKDGCSTPTGKQQDKAASRPPPSPLLPTSRNSGNICTHDNGASPTCNMSDATVAGADAEVSGGFGAIGRATNSANTSTDSLSTRSDTSSLDSAGSSDSSLQTGGSSSCSAVGGSSTREVVQNCCHGEPLEHHCVPPRVQALVVDEVRFTNMFKLVNYWLRRQAGCTHIQEPNITAFMQPVSAAAEGTTTASNLGATKNTICTVQRGIAATTVTAQEGAASAVAKGSAAAPQRCSAGSECDCGDCGLPELAAEKLAVALLMLPEAEGLLDEVLQQTQARVAGGHAADGPSADRTPTPGVPAPQLCGRPRCRKCRQRAAAAGDRVATLELLRERWRQLMGMAPLGLFASAPVLQDEVAYLRLQLSRFAQQPV